jgi:DNA polymerase
VTEPDAALVEWLRYLREIGVRELRASALVPPAVATPPRSQPRAASQPSAPAAPSPAASVPAAPVRTAPAQAAPAQAAPGQTRLAIVGGGFDTPPPADPAARLVELRTELGDCTRCKLHPGRTQIVFGVGDPRARLMFVGEGPGEEEDRQGEPFVGRAGKKLDEMIASIGLSREQVYIANVVKCRPPDNREPQPDEIASCRPFLFGQIEAIRPRVIVTLGAPATRLLVDTREGITRTRGRWHSYRGIPVMPTFHPAYLLRAYTHENRSAMWSDLKAARARLDHEG